MASQTRDATRRAELPITHESIAARHLRVETAPGWWRCSWDREVWPCDAIRLAAALAALQEPSR